MKRLGWLAVATAGGLAACWAEEPARAPVVGRVDAGSDPAPSPRALATADGGAAPAFQGPVAGETLEARAERVHRQAIVVDGHNDIPSVMLSTGYDLGTPSTKTHTDLARMKAGGITGEFFSIYVDADLATSPTVKGGGALRRAIDLIDVTYRQVERHPAELLLATTAADIRRAKREGKVAVLMGIEGGHAIENSLGALRVLHRLGCRYMTLTHSNTNEWADSAGLSGPPVVRHHGLAPFGEEVVREMQRVGMLVDVSHVSDETFWSVMKVAKAPVIASHSSTRALGNHRRDLTDDMLRGLAKNGGVAMVNFWSMLLSPEYAAAIGRFSTTNAKALTELRAKYKDDRAAYRDAVDKLRAADGVDALPEGLTGMDSLPKITLELMKRGYSDEDVLRILGGNFMRVFEATEAFARATGTTLSGDGSMRTL